MKLLRIAMLACIAMLAAPVVAQYKGEGSMEVLRQKIKADKKALVAANMLLTEAEAKAFWPVYEAYQKDLQHINERLDKTILGYAEAHSQGTIANDTAKKLIDESFAVDEAELRLRRAYVPKLAKALPGSKVVRYMQIENKSRAIVRFDLAYKIPLAQ